MKNIKISLFGISYTLIFLAFFFAKIFNLIDWSWWWVFSPLWVPAVVVLLIVILLAILYIIYTIVDSYGSYR